MSVVSEKCCNTQPMTTRRKNSWYGYPSAFAFAKAYLKSVYRNWFPKPDIDVDSSGDDRENPVPATRKVITKITIGLNDYEIERKDSSISCEPLPPFRGAGAGPRQQDTKTDIPPQTSFY